MNALSELLRLLLSSVSLLCVQRGVHNVTELPRGCLFPSNRLNEQHLRYLLRLNTWFETWMQRLIVSVMVAAKPVHTILAHHYKTNKLQYKATVTPGVNMGGTKKWGKEVKNFLLSSGVYKIFNKIYFIVITWSDLLEIVRPCKFYTRACCTFSASTCRAAESKVLSRCSHTAENRLLRELSSFSYLQFFFKITLFSR